MRWRTDKAVLQYFGQIYTKNKSESVILLTNSLINTFCFLFVVWLFCAIVIRFLQKVLLLYCYTIPRLVEEFCNNFQT